MCYTIAQQHVFDAIYFHFIRWPLSVDATNENVPSIDYIFFIVWFC